MTADKFVEIVRKGSEKLRVDNLVLNAGEHEVHGRGVMRITLQEIELDMTLDSEEEPPDRKSVV